jgi:hypothetical protein
MDLRDVIANVKDALHGQFHKGNAKRLALLTLFKTVERSCNTFPYLNTRLKPMYNLLAMESLFLVNDLTFSWYDRANRHYLEKMKDDYENVIQRIIKTYMKKCDLLLTKERLKQYITLNIRKDIVTQSLIGKL